ncbi:NB-ARC domain-containing protein [Calothrix sp. NIES-2100]|uniref:ATP-binding protein n=1 Tax=Calothrix sp. NIES-2100 TaxID=1954172 RepID=UPI000B616220|nr:NB-ARC domain-containing protein [Calothrix sp. NIES-2100]
MSNSLRASTAGLVIVDKARSRLGWTKTSTARWWQDAHTSRATLRRFWQGDRIQREIFIAICDAVGIANWEAIADASHVESEMIADISTPFLDWNEAPDVESFYGRDRELTQLEQWIFGGCKLVMIVGIAGIGKSALTLALIDRIQSHFNCLIWKSLHSAPSLDSLIDSLLTNFESSTDLIHHLQKQRCLLILDGLDADVSAYNQFIQKISRDRHQSCIIITSRESPQIEVDSKTVRCLNLKGLAKAEAVELWRSRGFTGKEIGLSALIQLYRGNPLALKLVTPLIQLVFGGNVAAFLTQNTLVIGDRLRDILKQQFAQLSDLEQDILYWLAIWREPVAFARLQTHLLISIDPAMVLEAIMALERRSLLEKWIGTGEISFSLQPLVMKVVNDELVEHAAQEIQQVVQSQDLRHFKILRTHWLLRPGTDDIAGDRILHQLRENLWRVYGVTLPQTLEQILLLLKDQSTLAIGYIACNLAAILKQLSILS